MLPAKFRSISVFTFVYIFHPVIVIFGWASISSTNILVFFRYPQALHFLELLQYDQFRKELANQQCAKFIDDQQLLHWQHYQRKRVQLLTAQNEHASEMGQMSDVKPSWT